MLAITNGVVLIGDGNISELALLIDDKVVGLVREDELINYPISKIIDEPTPKPHTASTFILDMAFISLIYVVNNIIYNFRI